MNLKDIPDLKSNRYPKRITLALSVEMYEELAKLKREHGKDTAEFVRKVLSEALKKVA